MRLHRDRALAARCAAPADLDGKPFCPTGYAQRYHDIGECDCLRTDTTDLRRLAEAATPGGDWYAFGHLPDATFVPEDAAYIAAVSPDRILALLAEVDALLSRLDTARRVAVHWRDAYLVNLRSGEGGTQWAIGTHPLNLVIDALDGETNPVELGVPAEALARLDALGDER